MSQYFDVYHIQLQKRKQSALKDEYYLNEDNYYLVNAHGGISASGACSVSLELSRDADDEAVRAAYAKVLRHQGAKGQEGRLGESPCTGSWCPARPSCTSAAGFQNPSNCGASHIPVLR